MLDFAKNHFELFGLPEAFTVDPELLSERYRALQHALHPDRFAAAGQREKRLSMQASTRVNEAYQTLRNPLARARYLLFLFAGETAGENETTKDMAFLMDQMELREVLAAAKGRADPHAEIGAVMDRLGTQSRQLVGELGAALDARTAESLQQARELVRKLQFIEKALAEADRIEAELEEAP